MKRAAIDTLYRSFRARLSGQSVWDTRLYPHAAPKGAIRPLLVYNKAAGGDSNRLHHRAPGFLIDVICVASGDDDPYQQAMDGKAVITALLDNQGYQNKNENNVRGVVIGDDDWLIKTIVQEDDIDEVDDQEKVGQFVYYGGHTFRIEMEGKR